MYMGKDQASHEHKKGDRAVFLSWACLEKGCLLTGLQRLTALATSAGKGRLGDSDGRCLLLWLVPPVLPLFSVCCPEDLHTHDPTPN